MRGRSSNPPLQKKTKRHQSACRCFAGTPVGGGVHSLCVKKKNGVLISVLQSFRGDDRPRRVHLHCCGARAVIAAGVSRAPWPTARDGRRAEGGGPARDAACARVCAACPPHPARSHFSVPLARALRRPACRSAGRTLGVTAWIGGHGRDGHAWGLPVRAAGGAGDVHAAAGPSAGAAWRLPGARMQAEHSKRIARGHTLLFLLGQPAGQSTDGLPFSFLRTSLAHERIETERRPTPTPALIAAALRAHILGQGRRAAR